MNLSEAVRKTSHRKAIEDLVVRGLIGYQPFIFADDLQVGVGYEFGDGGEGAGLAWWPTIDPSLLDRPEIRRWIVDADKGDAFAKANQHLRLMYDDFLDRICAALGDVRELSFADVGCNTGYFPIGFSLRGARDAAGFDRDNYSEPFSLINKLAGARARFTHLSYDGRLQAIPDAGRYDVVTTVAVLCHLSDPLQFLAALGRMARRALFVWTPVTEDDDYCIRFGEPNKYYTSDPFPWCFDNKTRPSERLLRRSLELMGFTDIREFRSPDSAMPREFCQVHKAFLALRSRPSALE